jgi:uncharacterized membrane protein YccC
MNPLPPTPPPPAPPEAPPEILFDPQPDPLEVAVRFVCGFLFGLLAGWLVAFKFDAGFLTLLVMVIAALACGGLAVRQGDRFWERLLK